MAQDDEGRDGTDQRQTVYSAADFPDEPITITRYDFEPEVVEIAPPPSPSASDFDPDAMATRQPTTRPPSDAPAFYDGVLDYPNVTSSALVSSDPSPVKLQATREAEFERSLRRAVAAGIPPAAGQGPTGEERLASLLGGASNAFKLGELAGAWSAPAAASPATIFTGLILKTLAEIGKANEQGKSLGARNAYRWGFSATLAALANGRDWTPKLSRQIEEGYRQWGARNDAVRFLRSLGKEAGTQFLKRYERADGFATALKDMGGYESSLPPCP